ncbi:MAG: sigma-54 dependent transcriptional regulator [Pyrinomonadaceae bacterium]
MARASSERSMVDYIKPVASGQIMSLVERARPLAEAQPQSRPFHPVPVDENGSFGIIGNSQRMRQVYETISMTAPSDAPVLIEGESGTGKELIASAFHLYGARADRPFISINCAAIPQNLIESELFGHKKGAFTGADRDKRGLVEAASGGTLFLDEIAEMPAHLQTKLLRVIQERKLRRLGDEQEIEVHFRLVSATNRDTAQAITSGALREDLYFRLSTIKIKVPPLRERPDDLPLLARFFLERYCEKYCKPIKDISQAALLMLLHHDWPGNVRELESAIESAVLFCQGERIIPENLPEHIQASQPTHSSCVIPGHLTLEEIEREAIKQMLKRTGGNVKRTAELLNINRPKLYRRMKKFKLKGESADSI